jgi:hypothetical protein
MNPRFKYFPWYADYINQANIFAPYIMASAQPDYRSGTLNTDSLGFRRQYDYAGRVIDLNAVKNHYPSCTLLLGNSSAFGVSLTGDKKTLGHYLNTHDSLTLNLSVRGATMQQELLIFLMYKHILPPVKKIVLLTGICDISLATQPEDLWSPITGGMHSIDTFFKQHYFRIDALGPRSYRIKNLFLDWAEDFYHKHSWIKRVFERRLDKLPQYPEGSDRIAQTVAKTIFPVLNNVLETWSWVHLTTGIDIRVVLQPIIGWSDKPLSKIENECLKYDLERNPRISSYTNKTIYDEINHFMENASKKHGLTYHDSNLHFNPLTNDETAFSDFCHLTDHGTATLGTWLSYIIQNRSL